MFLINYYILIALSICTGLLSLLASVGIFVSLTVQRRVERLQEILEQLIDQTYEQERNLTGNIYRLIEKYQMYYLLPDSPSRTIMRYIDSTIIVVTLIFSGLLFISYKPPLHPGILLYALPIATGFGLFIFFRRLLKNAINPLDNRLFNTIIPPPFKLHSISFLSSYVNASTLSILKQVRLSVVIRNQKKKNKTPQSSS